MDSRDDLTTRAAIRNAATKLFAERGFSAATVRQVAAEAGVSPGLVVHHFGSKAGLKAAVVERIVDWFEDGLRLSEAPSSVEAVRTRDWREVLSDSAGYYESADTLPDLLAWLVAEDEPGLQALFDKLLDRTTEVLDAYVRLGLMVPDPEPRERAAMLLAADLGSLLLRRQVARGIGYDPYAPEHLERWGRVGERVFAGVLVPLPSPPDDAAPHPTQPQET